MTSNIHSEVHDQVLCSRKWSLKAYLRIFILSVSRALRVVSSSGKNSFRLHDVRPNTIFSAVIVVVVNWRYRKILNFQNNLKQRLSSTKHPHQHSHAFSHDTNVPQNISNCINNDYSSFENCFCIITHCLWYWLAKYNCLHEWLVTMDMQLHVYDNILW